MIKWERYIKQFCSILKYDCCFKERHLYNCLSRKNKPCLFRLDTWQICLQDEWNQMVTSKKPLTVFVSNNTIWVFKRKLEVLKTYIHHCEFDDFPKLNCFSDDTSGDNNDVNFWGCIMKYVSIWNICLTHWTMNFPVTNTWSKSNMVKHLFK